MLRPVYGGGKRLDTLRNMIDQGIERRSVAVTEMPDELRHDVRLLGKLLGQVLAEQGGEDLLADVEGVERANTLLAGLPERTFVIRDQELLHPEAVLRVRR